MKKILFFLNWSFIFIFYTASLSAQNPVLDVSFAKKGIRKITCKKGVYPSKLLLQSAGKLLVAGTIGNKRKTEKGRPETDFALFQFDANGRLDKSFGKKGKVIVDIKNQIDQMGSAIIQSDGKIVVTGNTGKGGIGSFVVLRFLADGRLDPSFGEGGKQITKIGEGSNTGKNILLQADGKIILIGNYYDGYDEDFVLLRYTQNGELDTSFGKEGKVITDFEAHNDDANCALLLADGRILVGGTHDELGKARNIALACYLPDGSLDKNFGSKGRAYAKLANVTDEMLEMFEDPTETISILGRTRDPNDFSSSLFFSRYTKMGLLDQSFHKGRVEYKTGMNTVFPSAGWKQSDGKMMVVGGLMRGEDLLQTTFDFAIVRYQEDARLDPTFNGDGLLRTKVDKKFSIATSLLPLEGGKLAAMGVNKTRRKKNKLILVRYTW